MRLQKYMAKCGVASRRKSEEIILEGRVQVNDKIITELGTKIELDKDIVKVDGRIIKKEENKVYIMLNKPIGYVTTVEDEFNEKIVMDLVENIEERIFPVGRLDKDSEGLLLLTNDGKLTYQLTHPRYEVKKTYIVDVEGIPNEEDLNIIRNGIMMDGSITSKAEIYFFENKNRLKVKIHEGRNRQVRRMFAHINHPVINLKRISLGSICLGDLKVGSWRELTVKEIELLKKDVE